MPLSRPPVVIVGAGIIGLLCAWYLVRAGRQPLIIDRLLAGRESSWAGAGILAPLDPAAYPLSVLDLTAKSAEEYEKVKISLLNPDYPQFIRSGMIIVKDSWLPHHRPLHLANVTVNPSSRLFPWVTQVRNPRLIKALSDWLIKRGVEVQENTAALDFRARNGRLSSITTAKGDIRAEACIVAAGAWSGALLQSVGLALPIRPIKGQMVLLSGCPHPLKHILVGDHCYLVPRLDGRVLVGSTIEDVGFDKTITDSASRALLAAATKLVPELAGCRVEAHWAGLRPGSPDSIPFIGEYPKIKGLFVCAGHYRAGFATGPASAKLVVDMLLEKGPQVGIEPFRLERSCPAWPITGRS